MTSYQPIITEKYLEGIKNGVYNLTEQIRPTVSRIQTITNDIKHNLNIRDISVLDVGCNSGAFCHTLAYLGATCLGIDNNGIYNAGHVDEKPIDLAINIAKNFNIPRDYFFECDILDYFINNKSYYNVTLVLNILHNLALYKTFRGNRPTTQKDVEDCLKRIWDATNDIMYIEHDTSVGKWFNWGPDQYLTNLRNIVGKDAEIVKLCDTESYNGNRAIYKVIKHCNKNNYRFSGKVELVHGTGTANKYINKYEENFKKALGFAKMYAGTINVTTPQPIQLFPRLKDAIINYSNRPVDLTHCRINGVFGYITTYGASEANVYEFFTDREVSNLDNLYLEIL